jgi:hypothetical protein
VNIAAAVALMLALSVSLLATLAACLYRHKVRLPAVARGAVVTLILPLTAIPREQLRRLMQALDRQSLKPRRLVLSVESEQDPVCSAARLLAAERWCYDVEVLVAGASLNGSQKCRNLIAAVARLGDEDDAIVLLDADIEPTRWWLSALVSPLIDGRCDLVTGYRWPIIRRHSLGGAFIAAIDRTLAVLPRPRSMALAWGGSLAISRYACQRLSLPRILEHTLSDDLAIAAAASALGLRVLHRRALLVPTPVRLSLPSAWLFGRRQYSMVRLYRPRTWCLALFISSTLVIAWVILLASISDCRLARAGLILVLAVVLVKTWALDSVGRRLGLRDPPMARLSQYALIFIKPLLDLFHLGIIVSAAHPRTLTWGHVTYQIREPDRITVSERRPWSDS